MGADGFEELVQAEGNQGRCLGFRIQALEFSAWGFRRSVLRFQGGAVSFKGWSWGA